MVAVAGLPVIAGLSCPPSAAALGAAGLGPACQVASGAKSVVGSAASSLVGFGANTVLDALGSWVSDGATWLLSQIGGVMATTTSIDLGASWFTAHYQIMAALAGVVIMPLLLLGIMQSIYRQSGSTLVRSVLVNVPLSILLTAVAVKLVQIGLAVTDAMSSAIAQGSGLDGGHFLAAVTKGLTITSATEPSAPAFVMFVGGLAVVVGALAVWVELLIRAAAVYVAVLFLPLALASLAWPAIAHWCRRLVDTLVALVLGKFVIVAVLSLAAGALAGGTGSAPGSGSGSGSGVAAGASGSGPAASGGGFAAVLGGAALLLFAAFAPWALFRLLPFLEAGAVGHLESVGHRARQSAGAPVKGMAQVAMRSLPGGSLAGFLGHAVAGATSGRSAGSGGSGGGSSSSSGLAGVGSGARAGAGVGGAEPGPGGDGPEGTRPDAGPSSAESTGVGTTEPPAHNVPSWAVDSAATAKAEGRTPSDAISTPAPSSLPAGTGRGTTRPTGSDTGQPSQLPVETAALHVNALGRDELGVHLITAPIKPLATPEHGRSNDGDSNRGS